MGKYVLAMYDVRGKQDFIFRTNKLKEIVGGSWIIRDIFKDYLLPAAKNAYPNSNGIFTGEAFSSESFMDRIEGKNNIVKCIGEVVYEGGGNFLVLFKDEDTFKKVTYFFTKKIAEEIGTLQVLGTCVEIDNFDDYGKNISDLYKKHRINETQSSNVSPWACLPIVQVDRKTSRPLVDLESLSYIPDDIKGRIAGDGQKHTRESIAKLAKYYKEKKKLKEEEKKSISDPERDFYLKNEDMLDSLVTEKGVESQLAVVYIDGNNMGAKVQERTNNLKSYNDTVKELRAFSKEIQELYVTNGVKAALSGIEDKHFRIVVSAGDEINFIVNAQDAFRCAQNYLDHLKNSDENASACAGIAVFNSHAPYADAYRIAEEACESGKQKMKKAKISNAAFIDFHICQGAIGLSLDEIRDEENGDVISRPWMMWMHDQKEEIVEDVTDFDKEVTPIKNYLNSFSRSNVKGLFSAAKEGIVPLQMEINRMYGHADEKTKDKVKNDWENLKSELSNTECQHKLRSIIYDLVLGYDLWFAK